MAKNKKISRMNLQEIETKLKEYTDEKGNLKKSIYVKNLLEKKASLESRPVEA